MKVPQPLRHVFFFSSALLQSAFLLSEGFEVWARQTAFIRKIFIHWLLQCCVAETVSALDLVDCAAADWAPCFLPPCDLMYSLQPNSEERQSVVLAVLKVQQRERLSFGGKKQMEHWSDSVDSFTRYPAGLSSRRCYGEIWPFFHPF